MFQRSVCFAVMCLAVLEIETSIIEILPMLLEHREPQSKFPNSESIYLDHEAAENSPSTEETVTIAVKTTPTPKRKEHKDNATMENTDVTKRPRNHIERTRKKSFKKSGEVVLINDNKKRSRILKDKFNEEFIIPKLMSPLGENNFAQVSIKIKPYATEKVKSNRQGGPRRTVKTYMMCEGCVKFCKNGGKPICAKSPTAGRQIIDGDALRGFPSRCHLTCFNLCRKQKYEFLADGRCGKFRNRVKPLDSDKTMSKDQLDSAKYEVLDVAGSNTAVAFMPTLT